MIPDPSPPFEFQPSGLIAARIRSLIAQAAAIGLRPEAIRAFAVVEQHLTSAPRDWGDPIRQFSKSKSTEFRAQHWDLQFRYTVHDRIPIVFLTEITPLPDSPLFGL